MVNCATTADCTFLNDNNITVVLNWCHLRRQSIICSPKSPTVIQKIVIYFQRPLTFACCLSLITITKISLNSHKQTLAKQYSRPILRLFCKGFCLVMVSIPKSHGLEQIFTYFYFISEAKTNQNNTWHFCLLLGLNEILN